MFVEKWSHFIGLMGEFSTSLSGPLGLRGSAITRLDRLAKSDGPMVVSVEVASPTTLSGLGGLLTGVPSFKDGQASLEAS